MVDKLIADLLDDGDSTDKLRFDGVDAPETRKKGRVSQPVGDLATLYAKENVADAVGQGEFGYFGRELAVPVDSEGNDLREKMINLGLYASSSQDMRDKVDGNRLLRLMSGEEEPLTQREQAYKGAAQHLKDTEPMIAESTFYSGPRAKKESRVSRAIDRGWEQTQASFGAAAQALGHAIGNENLVGWGEYSQAFNEAHASLYERDSRDLRSIFDDQATSALDKTQEAVTWAIETGFEETIPMAIDLSIAAALAPIGGAGAGYLATKHLAKRGAQKSIARYLDDKLAEKAIGSYVGRKKAHGAKRFAQAGLMGSQVPQSVGEAEMVAQELGLETGGFASIFTGLLTAGIDTTADWLLVGKLLNARGLSKEASKSIALRAKQIAGAGASQAGIEGLTESIQEATFITSAVLQGGDISKIAPDGDWGTALAWRLGEAAAAGATIGGATGSTGATIGQLMGLYDHQTSSATAKAFEDLGGSPEPDIEPQPKELEEFPNAFDDKVDPADSDTGDHLDTFPDGEPKIDPTNGDPLVDPLNPDDPSIKESRTADPTASGIPLSSRTSLPASEFMGEYNNLSVGEQQKTLADLNIQAEQLVTVKPVLKAALAKTKKFVARLSPTKIFATTGDGIGSTGEHTTLADFIADDVELADKVISVIGETLPETEREANTDELSSMTAIELSDYLKDLAPNHFKQITDVLSTAKFKADLTKKQTDDLTLALMESRVNKTKFESAQEVREAVTTSIIQNRLNSDSAKTNLRDIVINGTEADIANALDDEGVTHSSILGKIIHAAQGELSTSKPISLTSIDGFNQAQLDEAMQSNFFLDFQKSKKDDTYHGENISSAARLHKFINANTGKYDSLASNREVNSRTVKPMGVFETHRLIPQEELAADDVKGQQAKIGAIEAFVVELKKHAIVPDDPKDVVKLANSSAANLTKYIVEHPRDGLDATDTLNDSFGLELNTRDVSDNTDQPLFTGSDTFSAGIGLSDGTESENRTVAAQQSNEISDVQASLETSLNRELNNFEQKMLPKILRNPLLFAEKAYDILDKVSPGKKISQKTALRMYKELTGDAPDIIFTTDLTPLIEYTANLAVDFHNEVNDANASPYAVYEQDHGESVSETLHKMAAQQHFQLFFFKALARLKGSTIGNDLNLVPEFFQKVPKKQRQQAIKLYRSMREEIDGEVNEFMDDDQFFGQYIDELYSQLSQTDLKKYQLAGTEALGTKTKDGFRGTREWQAFMKTDDVSRTFANLNHAANRQVQLHKEKLIALLPDAPRDKTGRHYRNQLLEVLHDGSLQKFMGDNNIGYQSEYEPTHALSTGYSNSVNRSLLRHNETAGPLTPTIDVEVATSPNNTSTLSVKFPTLVASILSDAQSVIAQPNTADVLQGFYAAVQALQTYVTPDGHSTHNVDITLDKLPSDMVIWHDGRGEKIRVADLRRVADGHEQNQSVIIETGKKRNLLESTHGGVALISELIYWQSHFENLLPELTKLYGNTKPKKEKVSVGELSETPSITGAVQDLLVFLGTTIENNRYKYGISEADFDGLYSAATHAGETKTPEGDAALAEYLFRFNNSGLDLSLFADNPKDDERESVTEQYQRVKKAVAGLQSRELGDVRTDVYRAMSVFHALQDLSHTAHKEHRLISDTPARQAVDYNLNDHAPTAQDEENSIEKDLRDGRNDRLSGDKYGKSPIAPAIDPKPEVQAAAQEKHTALNALIPKDLPKSPYADMKPEEREPILKKIADERAEKERAKYKTLVNNPKPTPAPKNRVRTEAEVKATETEDKSTNPILDGAKNPFGKVASDLMATIKSTTPIKVLTGKMSATDRKRYGKDFNETLAGTGGAFSMVRDGTLLVYIPFDSTASRESMQSGILELGHEIGHYLLTEASESKYFAEMQQEYADENPSIEFNEWFSDKVAKALLEKKEQAYGKAVFLRKIGDQLKALYMSVAWLINKASTSLGRRTYFTASQPFSSFIDDIFTSNKPRNFNFAEGKKPEFFMGSSIPKKPIAVTASKMSKAFKKLTLSMQRQAGNISPAFRELLESYTKIRRVAHSNINGAGIKPKINSKQVDKGYADWLLGTKSTEHDAMREWFGNIGDYFHSATDNKFSFLDKSLFSNVPLRFATSHVEKDTAKFIKILEPILKDTFGRDVGRMQAFVENLLDANGYVSLANNTNLDTLVGVTPPKVNDLAKQILGNKKVVRELLDAGYIDTNGVSVTQTYVAQLATFAAYGAAFGGRPVNAVAYYHPNLKLQTIYRGLKTAEEREHMSYLHDALTGRLNRTMPYKLRTVQSYAITMSNMSILAFAGIASLPDIATPMIKTYSLGTTLKGLGYLAKSPRVMYSIAKALGTVSSQYMQQNLGQLYGNGELAAGLPRIASDIFFKLNMQTLVNNLNQFVGAAMGTAMIEEIHLNPQSALSKRLMAEYDMDMSAIDKHFNGDTSPAVSRHYDDVMTRFLTNTQMMGERAYRSPLAQNPWALMATNLKNFPYDYAETVLFPVFNESKARWKNQEYISAMLPTVFAAALLMPFAALGWELREWLRDGKSPSDLPTPEYLAGVMKRTGALAYAEIVIPLYYADKYHNPYITAMIPTLGMGYDVIKADKWEQKAKRISPFINQGVPKKWNPFD